MSKLRITFKAVLEYELDAKNYPEGMQTPEDMLKIDIANAGDDPMPLLADLPIEITGEIVEEKP